MTEAIRPRRGPLLPVGRVERGHRPSEPVRDPWITPPGAPERPIAGDPSRHAVAAMPAGARAAVARKAVEARRPYHVGVFLGVSAGVYAMSLAGVTALQSASDRSVAEARQPSVAALDTIRAAHDALDRRLAAGGAAYEAAAGGYQRAADALGALERELDALAKSVGRVDGIAGSLPSRVTLPSLPRSAPVVVAAAAPPVTHATTGASGKP